MAEQMGMTNIAKTIAAKQDEEVWLELQFYRDQKHLDDLVAEVQKMKMLLKLVNSLWIYLPQVHA